VTARQPMFSSIAGMRGDALASEVDLERSGGKAEFDLLGDQSVGNRVVVSFKFDVVVDVDLRELSLREDERSIRQRPKHGLIEFCKQFPTTGAVASHGTIVELFKELSDPTIEFCQREKRLVAKHGQDPALHDLDGHFDLGLVLWLARSGWQGRRAVVLGHLFVGALKAGLVTTCFCDAALQLIRNEQFRHAAEVLEGANMGGDEVGRLLTFRGFRIGVVRGASCPSNR